MGARTGKKCLLVTVGTTRFDALIEAIISEHVSKVLMDAGYSEWRVQYGALDDRIKDRLEFLMRDSDGPRLTAFSYRPSLEQDIEWADLVIGHAGIPFAALLTVNARCWYGVGCPEGPDSRWRQVPSTCSPHCQ